MLIASKLVVNESKQGVELLVENPMLPPPKLLRQLEGKPKLRGKLRKKPHIENEAEHATSMEVEAQNKSLIKTEDPQDRLVI